MQGIPIAWWRQVDGVGAPPRSPADAAATTAPLTPLLLHAGGARRTVRRPPTVLLRCCCRCRARAPVAPGAPDSGSAATGPLIAFQAIEAR